MSHASVRLSGYPRRTSPRNFGGAKARFESIMKNRFPTLHHDTWRSHFVAIARQADVVRRAPAPAPEVTPRRLPEAAARTAIRVRFAALTARA